MMTAMNSDTAGLSHVFLSPDELAAALPGVTKSTLAMWRYEGKGPRYRGQAPGSGVVRVPSIC